MAAPVLPTGGRLVENSGGFPSLARDDIAKHWTGSSSRLPWSGTWPQLCKAVPKSRSRKFGLSGVLLALRSPTHPFADREHHMGITTVDMLVSSSSAMLANIGRQTLPCNSPVRGLITAIHLGTMSALDVLHIVVLIGSLPCIKQRFSAVCF